MQHRNLHAPARGRLDGNEGRRYKELCRNGSGLYLIPFCCSHCSNPCNDGDDEDDDYNYGGGNDGDDDDDDDDDNDDDDDDGGGGGCGDDDDDGGGGCDDDDDGGNTNVDLLLAFVSFTGSNTHL